MHSIKLLQRFCSERGGNRKPFTHNFVSAIATFLWIGLTIVAISGLTSTSHAVDVTTYHNDAGRTGQNVQETVLNVATVSSSKFNLLRQVTLPVNEQVDAQPLVVSAATFAAAGLQSKFPNDVVYVATENNNIYAIDSSTGTILLQNNFGVPVSINNLPGQCTNNFNTVGITSTPVIVLNSGLNFAGLMYAITYTWENSAPVYRIHAINLFDLSEWVPSVIVAASHNLSDGTVTTFQAASQRQRPALLLNKGYVYAGFGSFCDFNANTSRGWIMAWSTGTLQPLSHNGLADSQTLTQAENYLLSSIWMSGYGPAADLAGNIYFLTGNSNGTRTNNFPESAVKMSSDLVNVVDYFTPSNFAALDSYDQDFGSGGIMVVPDLGITHFAVAAGKDGRMFLFRRLNMGGFVPGGPDQPSSVNIGGCWCGPAYFVGSDGKARIVSSGGTWVQTWLLPNVPTGTLTHEATSFGIPGGQDPGFMTSVSSNGGQANSAVIWAVSRPVNGNIYLQAFNATASGGQLQQLQSFVAGSWTSSSNNASLVPTVANGKVYVASLSSLAIFGLAP
jgi:hypothetical protein